MNRKKKSMMRRSLLKFPVIFHVCTVEINTHPGGRGSFLTKEDTLESGLRGPRSPGRRQLGRKRSQSGEHKGSGQWEVEELCQLGQAGLWWLSELLVLVGEYVETSGVCGAAGS